MKIYKKYRNIVAKYKKYRILFYKCKKNWKLVKMAIDKGWPIIMEKIQEKKQNGENDQLQSVEMDNVADSPIPEAKSDSKSEIEV